MSTFDLAKQLTLSHDHWERLINWRSLFQIGAHHETTDLFKDITRADLLKKTNEALGVSLSQDYHAILHQVDGLNAKINDEIKSAWHAYTHTHVEFLKVAFSPGPQGHYQAYDNHTASTLTFLLKNNHYISATLARDGTSVFGYLDIVSRDNQEYHCRINVDDKGNVFFTTEEDFYLLGTFHAQRS